MSTNPGPPPFEQMPGPPTSPSYSSPEFGGAPLASPPRGWGRIVVAVVSILALVAGGAFFLLSRQPEPTRALTLSFAEGGTERYALQMHMDGSVSTSSPAGSHGYAMDVTENLSWKVLSVDDEGVATLAVTIKDLTGTLNQKPLPVPPQDITCRIRIAPDGRILTGGNLSFASAGSTQGFPGMDQFSALLPARPVAPGDTWRRQFIQPIAFGQGEIRYAARSRFERYEEIDGVRTAVISSYMSVPMDFTLKLRKLMKTLGQSPAQAGLPPSARPRIIYHGRGAFKTTSWIAPDTGVLVKSISTGRFSLGMHLHRFPRSQVPLGASVSVGGWFRMEMHRL